MKRRSCPDTAATLVYVSPESHLGRLTVFPGGKWFHTEIRFHRTVLSVRSGVNGNRPPSFAWIPKCYPWYCFSIKASSEVHTSIHTNL